MIWLSLITGIVLGMAASTLRYRGRIERLERVLVMREERLCEMYDELNECRRNAPR